MGIQEIIERFKTTYTANWFEDCQSKFEKFPYNSENNSNNFLAPIENYEFKEDNWVIFYKEEEYTLYDFCLGLKSVKTDTEPFLQENKFITIGELPNGYPHDVLEPHESFINYFPKSLLVTWRNNFQQTFQKEALKVELITDRSKYMEYIRREIDGFINGCLSSSKYTICINKFLEEEIIGLIDRELMLINPIIQIIESPKTTGTKLSFNVTLAGFCKLFFFLVEKGIVNYENNPKDISDYFRDNIKIKKQNVYKSPNSASVSKQLVRGKDFIKETPPNDIEKFLLSLKK